MFAKLICFLFGHNVTASSAVSFGLLNYHLLTHTVCVRCHTIADSQLFIRYDHEDINAFDLIIARAAKTQIERMAEKESL